MPWPSRATSTAPRPSRRRSATRCRRCGCRPGMAGLSAASPSSVRVAHALVRRSTCRVSPVGVPSSPSTGASIGRISRLKWPASRAWPCLLLRARPRRSMSSRVMPRWLGDALGGGELVGRRVPRPVGRLEVAGAVDHVGAEADAAHRLDAAGDADVDAPALDQGGDQVVRLLARSALRVDGRGADLVGRADRQPRVAHQVAGLLAGLGDAAADDLLDVVHADPGALEHALQRQRQQFGGVESVQPPDARLPPSDGGRTASTMTASCMMVSLLRSQNLSILRSRRL